MSTASKASSSFSRPRRSPRLLARQPPEQTEPIRRDIPRDREPLELLGAGLMTLGPAQLVAVHANLHSYSGTYLIAAGIFATGAAILAQSNDLASLPNS